MAALSWEELIMSRWKENNGRNRTRLLERKEELKKENAELKQQIAELHKKLELLLERLKEQDDQKTHKTTTKKKTDHRE